jgi:hypothetical protein
MLKSRTRWAGHVAGIGTYRNAYGILVENQEKRDHWEDLDVGEMIILSWIFEKLDGVVRNGLIWLRMGTSGGHDNEPSGSVKC